MSTFIVEVTFQFAVAADDQAADKETQAIDDAIARVLEAFPSLETGENVSATIEGEI